MMREYAVMDERIKALMDRVKADLIRETGVLERLCPHGIGHAVGHIIPGRWKDPKYASGVHGCDGCCQGWEEED